MSIIGEQIFPIEIIAISGEFMSVFLIILLSISLLVTDSIYWNMYAQNILGTVSRPLMVSFICIVIYKIILVI